MHAPWMPYVVLTITPLLVATGLLAICRWCNRGSAAMRTSERLFREISRAHGLRLREVRVVRRVAEASPQIEPLQLLVLPDRFDAAVARFAERWPDRHGRTIAAVRARLFEAAEPEAPESGTTKPEESCGL